MTREQVLVVRVYLTEGAQLERLVRYLHDDSGVRGVTVFRGITGFGPSGHIHSARLVESALDLPVVVEFFDAAARVQAVLDHLQTLVEPGHIVSWSAEVIV